MKQKIVRRASALVLAGCLLAGAALPALAASAKEEVIYANLDASGTVTGVYAVNSFAVQAGDTVTDHGSYTAVRNMTTTDPLEHSGDTITATAAQDGKLYYEGTMDTATALPWLVKLTYTLDGAEIAPEELGGKSGALAIRLQVSRNPDCTGDFFDQYALQVTMTLDTDRAQNIVADGATMANVGSNKQLSYILLPGSDSDVTVTADVTDFAMNAISLNGVKLRLNLGLDGADLTGMLDRLQSGSVQLDDGANALADGIAQVQAGLDTLNGKSGELTGGSAKVKAALTQMQTALNGVSASTDQLTTLLDASTQIQNGIAQLDAGAAQLDEQDGFFNLVILIPNREFDDRDFGYIAIHECCHIKNKDIWIKLLTEIYCGIFWWNPFAHLLKKDLTYCLELRCDKRVTSKLSENRCTVYYEVLVTQMKAYKEQQESEESDRETALKSALVGMSFVTNEKGKKIVSRMEMILYPKKKQTIINNIVTAFMALLIIGIFFGSYCFLIVPGWDATYEDCVADLVSSGEYQLALLHPSKEKHQ